MKTIKVELLDKIPSDFTGIAEFPDGGKLWFKNGVYHREDGPAIMCADGAKKWLQDGRFHREIGPCTSCTDCLQGNSELCSKPGPALEYPSGLKYWYQNDKYHREDGPAIENPDGIKKWYIKGENISEISFKVFKLCLEMK